MPDANSITWSKGSVKYASSTESISSLLDHLPQTLVASHGTPADPQTRNEVGDSLYEAFGQPPTNHEEFKQDVEVLQRLAVRWKACAQGSTLPVDITKAETVVDEAKPIFDKLDVKFDSQLCRVLSAQFVEAWSWSPPVQLAMERALRGDENRLDLIKRVKAYKREAQTVCE